MNILIINLHEPFIYNLSKTGHYFHIIEPKAIGWMRVDGKNTWHINSRPFPLNARKIDDLRDLSKGLANREFDIAIALTCYDLAFLKPFSIPKLYYPISGFRDEIQGWSEEDLNKILCHIQYMLKDYFIACCSSGMKEATIGNWNFPAYIFESPGGIDTTEDFHSYRGDVPAVLRVANCIQDRKYLNLPLQKDLLDGIPHLILGHNPGMPNARETTDWEDLKDSLRKYRLFLSVYTHDFYLGAVQSAQLEAMATGMPVVGTPFPGNIIEDGKNGFVSSDPQYLREKILLLLQNRDLALRLGENARKVVTEKFSFERYKNEWNKILEMCLNQYQRPANDEKFINRGAYIQLEGPVLCQPFSASNGKLIAAIRQENELVSIIPKEIETGDIGSGLEINKMHLVEHLKLCEFMGEGVNLQRDAKFRVISPFTKRHLSISELKENNIPTIVCPSWDYGSLPLSWVNTFNSNEVYQVWVNSEAERDIYQAEGICPNKLFVSPRGFDPTDIDFNPEHKYGFTGSPFEFLFVGNSYREEGGDIALQAYLDEFKPEEDVVLQYVCTSLPGELERSVGHLRKDNKHPRMQLYFYSPTSPPLQVFYRDASFAILPHRGITLPIFLPEIIGEGIACVINGFGGATDFLSWGTFFAIPASIQYISASLFTEHLRSRPYLGEPDLYSLRRIMRYAFIHQLEMKLRGVISRRKALKTMNWNQIAKKSLMHLDRRETMDSIASVSMQDLFEMHNVNFWLNKASLHLLLREWSDAEQCILTVMGATVSKERILSQAMLCEAYSGLGDCKAQELLFEILALKVIPDDLIPYLIKSSVHLEELRIIDKIIDKAENEHGRLLVVQALFELGIEEEAHRYYTKILNTDSDPLRYVIEGILLERLDPLRSLSNYEEASELDSWCKHFYFNSLKRMQNILRSVQS